MTEILLDYIAGAVTVAFLVASGFFLRFWRKTSDRLFLAFAAAFLLLALNQGIATFLTAGDERQAYAYVLRVLGFVLILWAVIDKNVPSRNRS
jgi:hypothetical protein